MQLKTVTVITGGKGTCDILVSQLCEMLDGKARVNGLFLDKGIPGEVRSDLVVIGSSTVADHVLPLLPSDCKSIVARRCLNHQHLDRLLEMPEATRALLVNDFMETAIETIGLLREAGINHLELHPYAPGHPLAGNWDLAITPGEPLLVPKSIKHIVDIGIRRIDLATLMKVLMELGIDDEQADVLSARFIRHIVEITKTSIKAAAEHHGVRRHLEAVLAASVDGIIGTDLDGRVSVINTAAGRILGVKSAEAAGRLLLELLEDAGAEVRGELIYVGKRQFLTSQYPVRHEDTSLGEVLVLRDVTDIQEMEKQLRGLLVAKGYEARYSFRSIVGSSSALKQAISLAGRIAKGSGTVLISGETGTGKELFAHAIHRESARAGGPFVTVNFASLPETLLESELFGYEEGAFTGARRGGKRGLFEEAHGGSIFLDEIGDAPLVLQAKLLRALEEGSIRRVGGTKKIPVDVRVIAASNKDLHGMTTQGEFRADLFYRLNVLPLLIPPLRSRKEDIPLLIAEYNRRLVARETPTIQIADDALDAMMDYDWPGNVRELLNTLEYLSSVFQGEEILPTHLPHQVRGKSAECLEPAINVLTNDEVALAMGIIARDPFKDEFAVLLDVLSTSPHLRLGRRKIAQTSAATNACLTEAKVRRLAARLAHLGLVAVRRGPEGILLTPLGEKVAACFKP
jgi:transcriptional regulator with PAS, ATPase and Fis domain